MSYGNAWQPQPHGAFQGYWMVPGGGVPVWLVVEDGGPAFIAAARRSGVRVRRTSYGVLLAVGFAAQ